MTETSCSPDITGEDLRAALKEMGAYIDVTEDDLKAIYGLAIKHASARLLQSKPVSGVMTRNVVSVRPTADINEAARLLSDHRITGMPVIDEGGRLVGVLSLEDVLSMAGVKRKPTLRDVVAHLLGEPLPGHRKGGLVRDFMTAPVVTVEPDADIGEASRILEEKKIRRLPVVDRQGNMVGIITRADIVRALGRI